MQRVCYASNVDHFTMPTQAIHSAAYILFAVVWCIELSKQKTTLLSMCIYVYIHIQSVQLNAAGAWHWGVFMDLWTTWMSKAKTEGATWKTCNGVSQLHGVENVRFGRTCSIFLTRLFRKSSGQAYARENRRSMLELMIATIEEVTGKKADLSRAVNAHHNFCQSKTQLQNAGTEHIAS